MYNVYMYMYVHRIAGIFSREKSYANWWNNGISWRKQERKTLFIVTLSPYVIRIP